MIHEELQKIITLQHDLEMRQLRADFAQLKTEVEGRLNTQVETVKQVDIYKWIFTVVGASVAIMGIMGFRGVGDLNDKASKAIQSANDAVVAVQTKTDQAMTIARIKSDEVNKNAMAATDKANLAAAQHAETEDALRSYVFADLVEEFDQVVNQIGSAGSKGEGPARSRLTATLNKLQLLQEAFLRHERSGAPESQESKMISLLMRFGSQTERTLIYFGKRTDMDEPGYLRDLADQQRVWEELLTDQLIANVETPAGGRSGDLKITKIAAYIHHHLARLHVFRSRVVEATWRKELDLAIAHEERALKLYSTLGRGLSNLGNFYAERARRTIQKTPPEELESIADVVEGDFLGAAGYHQAALSYADGPRDFSVRYNNKAVAAYQWADFRLRLADLAEQKLAGSAKSFRARIEELSKDANFFLDQSQTFGLETTEFSYTTRAELMCFQIAIDRKTIEGFSPDEKREQFEAKINAVIEQFKLAKKNGYVLQKSLARLLATAPILKMLEVYGVEGWEDTLRKELGLN